MKNGRAYISAISPTRFILALVEDENEVTNEQIGRYLQAINDPAKAPSLSGMLQDCRTSDATVVTTEDTKVSLAGGYIGSDFLELTADLASQYEQMGYIGLATREAGEQARESSYQPIEGWDLLVKSHEYNLARNGHNVALVQASRDEQRADARGASVRWTYRVTAAEQHVAVPYWNMHAARTGSLTDSRPPVQVVPGLSGLLFYVDCPKCAGRAGFGTRLALTLDQWNSPDGGFFGETDRTNRLVAVTGSVWTAVPDPEFHGKHEQVGRSWWSLGAPLAETSNFMNTGNETGDVFRWERREWLDREQAVTLFASLLLGLGITLWTELLIALLHTISPPKKPSRHG